MMKSNLQEAITRGRVIAASLEACRDADALDKAEKLAQSLLAALRDNSEQLQQFHVIAAVYGLLETLLAAVSAEIDKKQPARPFVLPQGNSVN